MIPTADPLPGSAVRAARQARGWTQTALAAALGAGRGAVAAWERGEVPPPWRVAVRTVLADELDRAEGPGLSGAELRRRREAAGLSREELAVAVGATTATVGSWETAVQVPARRVAALEAVLAGDAPIEEEPVGESEFESSEAVLARFSTAELAEEIARRTRAGS